MSAFLSLLRKELRALFPFLGLVLVIYGLWWAELLLNDFPDQIATSKMLEYSEGGEVVLFLLVFSLATGLLVREHDEGTLSFLDGLPLTRGQVFASKLAAGLGILSLMPICDLVTNCAIWLCSHTSLETHAPWSLLITAALLQEASLFVYLALGLALSFLRQFSWLALGLLVSAYLFFEQLNVPFVGLLNIFRLTEPTYQGYRWLIPTSELVAQLLLGLLCTSIAYAAFLMLGDRNRRLHDSLMRRRAMTVLAGGATVWGISLWLGLGIYAATHSDPPDDKKVRYAPWPTVEAKTQRYQFLYPENLSALALPLIDEADSIESRVRTFLGAEAVPQIEADMTGSMPRHLGVAHWKKVSIELRRFVPRGGVPSKWAASSGGAVRLAAVLAHETTHVYIDHESQSHVADDFNSTRFFHEGLASYVEYHLFLDQAPLTPPATPLKGGRWLPSLHRVAATMRSRGEVKWEELLDDKALSLKRDTDLVYPLGEMFVEALVERYGEAAPGKIVRAFARARAPKDLTGMALWRDLMQSCGYDLGAVEETFLANLDKAVVDQRKFIDAIPRLNGTVKATTRTLEVRVGFQADPEASGAEATARLAARPADEPPGQLLCRFRAESDTPPERYEYPSTDTAYLYAVPRSRYPHATFWYQLGWRIPGASQPIWEPWVEAPTQPE